MAKDSLFEELKKRRVYRTAAIYVAVAWGMTEIVVTVADKLLLPPWVSTLAVIIFIAGFPVAMFLAWTFDITSDGVQRTSLASRKGKLSVAGALILLLISTAGLFLLIKPADHRSTSTTVFPNSIAVMPFENASGNSEDDYLVAGLADDLRDRLGEATILKLAARSSSIAARRQQLGAVATSVKLGVAVLVEGRVRRRGSDLVVSVELVDGESGLVIWSNAFTRTVQEILFVQQSMADQILAKILPESQDVVSRTATLNASANELMLLAGHYETQVREQMDVDLSLLSKAIDLYRQATEVDPESAIAHSRLARALMYANDFAGAEAPIFRAVTLNPDLSEVQNTLGNYYLATGVKGAGSAFRRATELNGSNPDALADYAWWLWMQARVEKVEALYQRALERDRLSLSRYGALADFYGYTGRIPEALKIAERVEANFDSAAGMRLIARIMELVGRLDESIAWSLRARDREPDNADHVIALAELYAEIGDAKTAMQLDPATNIGILFKLRRYKELIDAGEYLLIDEPNDLELQILLSYAYTVVGQPELAIRLLTLAGAADRALGETRHPMDVEGLTYLTNALDAAGEVELAKQMATRWVERPHLDNDHWWVHIHVACPLAILGRDDEAFEHLVRVGRSVRLPWETLIRDMHCFQRYRDRPEYQQILKSVSARRAEQLKRLPATLQAFGVSL